MPLSHDEIHPVTASEDPFTRYDAICLPTRLR